MAKKINDDKITINILSYHNAREREKVAANQYGLKSQSLDILAYLYCEKGWQPIEVIRREVGISKVRSFTESYMKPLVKERYVRDRLNCNCTRDASITLKGRRVVGRIFL